MSESVIVKLHPSEDNHAHDYCVASVPVASLSLPSPHETEAVVGTFSFGRADLSIKDPAISRKHVQAHIFVKCSTGEVLMKISSLGQNLVWYKREADAHSVFSMPTQAEAVHADAVAPDWTKTAPREQVVLKSGDRIRLYTGRHEYTIEITPQKFPDTWRSKLQRNAIAAAEDEDSDATAVDIPSDTVSPFFAKSRAHNGDAEEVILKTVKKQPRPSLLGGTLESGVARQGSIIDLTASTPRVRPATVHDQRLLAFCRSQMSQRAEEERSRRVSQSFAELRPCPPLESARKVSASFEEFGSIGDDIDLDDPALQAILDDCERSACKTTDLLHPSDLTHEMCVVCQADLMPGADVIAAAKDCSVSRRAEIDTKAPVDLGVLPCKHTYCYDCIEQWSDRSTLCCLCKAPFNSIQRMEWKWHWELAAGTLGSTEAAGCWVRVATVDKQVTIQRISNDEEEDRRLARQLQEDGDDDEINWHCRRCGTQENGDRLLLCDGCDVACHTYCCRPALDDVPEGLWLCDGCDHAWRSQEDFRGLTKAQFVQQRQNQISLRRVALAAHRTSTGQAAPASFSIGGNTSTFQRHMTATHGRQDTLLARSFPQVLDDDDEDDDDEDDDEEEELSGSPDFDVEDFERKQPSEDSDEMEHVVSHPWKDNTMKVRDASNYDPDYEPNVEKTSGLLMAAPEDVHTQTKATVDKLRAELAMFNMLQTVPGRQNTHALEIKQKMQGLEVVQRALSAPQGRGFRSVAGKQAVSRLLAGRPARVPSDSSDSSSDDEHIMSRPGASASHLRKRPREAGITAAPTAAKRQMHSSNRQEDEDPVDFPLLSTSSTSASMPTHNSSRKTTAPSMRAGQLVKQAAVMATTAHTAPKRPTVKATDYDEDRLDSEDEDYTVAALRKWKYGGVVNSNKKHASTSTLKQKTSTAANTTATASRTAKHAPQNYMADSFALWEDAGSLASSAVLG